jgi:CRP-like cAMP-binding protein
MSSTPQKSYRPGQPIFTEGETPKSIYLITKGTVAIRKMKGNAFVELARLHPNEFLGELSFFDRQTRSASAYALTEVEATEISFDALEKLFAGTPPYLRVMISSMADRLRKADDLIKRLQKSTVTEGEAVETPQEEDLDAASALAAAAGALDGSGES